MVEEMLRLAEVVGTHSEKEEGCALNKRLLAAATVSVAKTKKEMSMFLIISTPLWLVKIVRTYDGRFTPITWVILIVLTAITMSIVAVVAHGILKFLWSLVRLRKRSGLTRP